MWFYERARCLLRDVEYLSNKDGGIKLHELSEEDEQNKEELGVN